MRRLFLMLTVILAVNVVYSQVPEKFNYQGVLRNSSGEIIKNTDISLQISLLVGSSTAPASYEEDHDVQTNNYGQFAIQIGGGTNASGSFSSIDWSEGQVYLKVSVDETGGTSYQDLPVVQLLTVPYAMYANDVANKDDADPDPENELQSIMLNGDTLSISDGGKVVLPYDSSNWVINGSTMYYNGGNVGIGSSVPVSNLEVKSNSKSTGALFQVINASNDTVFAVYPDGVKVFVNQDAKGKIGGFAVSGRTPSKGSEVDILKVTLDSTRIYVSDTINSKGKLGGFAVSGRTPSKATGINDYLVITPDSARIYVNDTLTSKGKLGGFAVSGRTPSKNGAVNDYLSVTRDSTRIYINESTTKGKLGGFAVSGRTPSKGIETDYFNISGNQYADKVIDEARIMWYPQKAALLAGEVHVGSADSVGTNSTALGYRSIALGDQSQAFGNQSQALGDYSTAIGNDAISLSESSFAFGNKAYVAGNNSYSLGDSAIVTKENSYAMGAGAQATGKYSFAIGSQGIDILGTPTDVTKATADYSYAFGMGSVASNRGAFALGTQDTASGSFSTAIGYKSAAIGNYSVALGGVVHATGKLSIATGSLTLASGDYSTATGFRTIAEGNYSTAMGGRTNALGLNSVAMGYETTAGGDYSMAVGYYSMANGDYSAALGAQTKANAGRSTAIGYGPIANGTASLATGFSTITRGAYSVSMGFNTIARSYASLVIGRYNDTLTTSWMSTWKGTDPIFIIGNGSDNNNRSNAMTVLQNGRVGIGTISPQGTLDVNGSIYQRGVVVHADYVFEDDYEIITIGDHSEFMWNNKHLPAVPKATKDKDGNEVVEWGARSKGVLEELELAHIYIDQLNIAIKRQQIQLEKIESKNDILVKENQKLKQKLDEIIKLLEQE